MQVPAQRVQNWQEPGPPGSPQPGQPAGSVSSVAELDTAPNAEREVAENVESFFRRSVPRQAGQAGGGDALRTSFSNSLPQAAHWYSNMGMLAGWHRDGLRIV